MTIDTDTITTSSQIDRIIVMKSGGEELFSCTLAQLLAALGGGGGGGITKTTSTATSVTLAFATDINHNEHTTTGNTTFSFSGAGSGKQMLLCVTLGSAGHNLIFSGVTSWSNGTTTAPTWPTASGSVIVISFVCVGTSVRSTGFTAYSS